MQPEHHTINYIELPMQDVDATKAFYSSAFAWTFTAWGPEYLSFAGAGIDGGFTLGPITTPGVLVVLYSDDLVTTQQSIIGAGGKICKEIFEFPGGRRFHFLDPNGNELAVWST